MSGLYNLGLSLPPPKKRRVFFSFHYADIMRVNNVRLSQEFQGGTLLGGGRAGREISGFYDFSLWESKRLEGPESLKRLIRDGVQNTSAICVLAGTYTWERPWVRYEIARAIVDNRGLLTVHINNLNHHKELRTHSLGPNPLAFMGVGKVQSGILAQPKYYIFELIGNGSWIRYQQYMQEVSLPRYLSDPMPGYVMPIGPHVGHYDFVAQGGRHNIGIWIDQAAQAVGR